MPLSFSRIFPSWEAEASHFRQSMKVHQFARGFFELEPTTLTLGCKRLRPLVPKLPHQTDVVSTAAFVDIKSFIRPESGPRRLGSSSDDKRDPPQVSPISLFHGNFHNSYHERVNFDYIRYDICKVPRNSNFAVFTSPMYHTKNLRSPLFSIDDCSFR